MRHFRIQRQDSELALWDSNCATLEDAHKVASRLSYNYACTLDLFQVLSAMDETNVRLIATYRDGEQKK